ncbi:MAG: hypothetical protein LUG60_03945 [Erysipelotrichaceae bacterium]|nr:hypothetical protein [Erysipelotrichaceae bacterium]
MRKEHAPRDLLLGIILFCIGVYIIFKNTYVRTFWGFYLGGHRVSSGLIFLPLLIGIVWKVIKPKSFIPYILIVISVIGILLSILMNITIWFTSTSLIDFVLMFGTVSVGLGLIIKALIESK